MNKMSFHNVMVSAHGAVVALWLVIEKLMDYLFSKAEWLMGWLSGLLKIQEPHLELGLAMIGVFSLLMAVLKAVFSILIIEDRLYVDHTPSNMKGPGLGCVAVKDQPEKSEMTQSAE